MRVLVDGVPMEEEKARELWARFSAWMEEHRGDLAGFAASEGFKSVHPGVDGGKPVLYASHQATQQAYATVRREGPPGGPSPAKLGESAGSKNRHDAASKPTPRREKMRDFKGRPRGPR